MRNKIKQIMKKEEGFTLVELLAVIVILGIIVAIAIPTIGNVIGTAEGNASEAEQELIKDAARLYEVGEDEPEFPVTVGTLKEKGYLDERSGELDDSISVKNDDGVFTLEGYPED
ncbi:hypothetical protein GCM10008932_13160 [Alkalibacterium iburiense]|uniref:Prepilin-type N-terminal cleavage/methylation domain-containing protein n=1 Tax=Alkalibacterium iburiense TaxID=290589 RepID=A0ABN0XEB6_9LACT